MKKSTIKRIGVYVAIIGLSLIFAACSTKNANKTENLRAGGPAVISKYQNPTKREETKKIEVTVEGQKDMRDATLKKSELGYSLYILKNFEFSSEEPNKNIIFSNYDKEFFVRIEKLDNKVNLAELKKTQEKAFSTKGKVIDMKPVTLFAPKFKDSKFCFLVNVKSQKKKGFMDNIIYVVKDFDGQLFSFTINLPLKEAAEGITPSLWAMISTLQVNK